MRRFSCPSTSSSGGTRAASAFAVESYSSKPGLSQAQNPFFWNSVWMITGRRRQFESSSYFLISRELESVRVVGGQELECRMEIPACARENLLEGVRAGKVETRLFQQMARLGLFYLEEAFSVCLYQVDEEGRNLAHYLAWIGEEAALGHVLSLLPTLANMGDEDGNTPLHLAVRGGAPCISAARLLLSLPQTMVDLQNTDGNTPLHIAARSSMGLHIHFISFFTFLEFTPIS